MRNWVMTIAFNLFETSLNFFIGYLIGLNIIEMLCITLLFAIPRILFKEPSHYRNPLKCLIVTTLLCTSMFLMHNVNELLGYLVAFFTGCILTEKGNIKNIYQWSSTTKHQLLIDYLQYNALSDEYLKAEKLLKTKVDAKTYHVYKRRFIDNWSYKQISEENDLENARIVEMLDRCYFYIIGRLGI